MVYIYVFCFFYLFYVTGPEYQLGKQYKGKDAIKLYFTPTPGHYEALATRPSVEGLCKIYIYMRCVLCVFK